MGTKAIIVALLMTKAFYAFSQENEQSTAGKRDLDKTKVFIGYELGEMAFNNFQNFSGEVGLKFKNDNLLRFVYQNVNLSEKHLSSNFARTVEGKNIKGLMKSYEVYYDYHLLKNLYLGASVGYANDYYEHTILAESVENFSATVGFAPSYRETDLFKVKGLYFHLAVPFRYYFEPLEETQMGNSKVNRHLLVNNIWFFVGYQF
ncbi:hypothetical protein ACFSKL_05695 [Belliella marina]|uniref:Outer membrane protein beta-barrel domain-containing protein n=1 Tax=Belliella marina TaxID=1644146 RepID=A0ABW4VNE9_9BACT